MSDTGRMLDDTAKRLLSRHFAASKRGGDGSSAALLAELAAAGLDLVLAPEDAGGLGAGLLEASAIAHRWGYHAAPGPIVDMLLLKELAAVAGAAVPEGAALTLIEDHRIDGGAWVAPTGGLKVHAPLTAANAAAIVACVADRTGRLVLVHFDAAETEARTTMAGETVAVLDLATVRPIAVNATETRFENLLAKGALLTASAIIGATQFLLEMTIEHANTRKQFGKPLGKFQAIQNMLAGAAAEHVVAQAATRSAVAALDAGRLKPLQWRAAKIQSALAATTVSAAAHQILGAIGFTEEHILHHYSKRLWTWRDDWGREARLKRQVGDDACANADRLWPWMVD
jgi:acyl-CoA dehydrogenase